MVDKKEEILNKTGKESEIICRSEQPVNEVLNKDEVLTDEVCLITCLIIREIFHFSVSFSLQYRISFRQCI